MHQPKIKVVKSTAVLIWHRMAHVKHDTQSYG
jgi:hypothetical protein